MRVTVGLRCPLCCRALAETGDPHRVYTAPLRLACPEGRSVRILELRDLVHVAIEPDVVAGMPEA